MSHRATDFLTIAGLSGAIVLTHDQIEFATRMGVAALAGFASLLAIYRHLRAIRNERRSKRRAEMD